MYVFILQRLLATLPVLLIVAVLVFLLLRLTPGDPAAIMAGDAANTEQIERIRAGLGLDRPIVVQFGIWLGKVAARRPGRVVLLPHQGDRAHRASASSRRFALAALHDPHRGRWWRSRSACVAAWRFGGWFDRALMGFSVLGFSVPVFVLAYLLIWLVSLKLGWLPVQGYRRLAEGFVPFLQHLILPSITLSVIYIALDRARHARLGARGARRGLHPHRARQGLAGAARAGAPRARQRRGADRHGDRHRHRDPDRRRGGHRVGLRHPGPRPPDRGRGAGARLPDHPGRDPVLLVRLRLVNLLIDLSYVFLDPQDPLLMSILDNWSVRIGGSGARCCWC